MGTGGRVAIGIGDGMGEGIGVGGRVGVDVEVAVGVDVGSGVLVGSGVFVGVEVFVAVGVGGVALRIAMEIWLACAIAVCPAIVSRVLSYRSINKPNTPKAAKLKTAVSTITKTLNPAPRRARGGFIFCDIATDSSIRSASCQRE